jgi:hypothetical protein
MKKNNLIYVSLFLLNFRIYFPAYMPEPAGVGVYKKQFF